MKKIVMFDNAGKILRYGVVTDRDVNIQTQSGENIMIVDKLEPEMDLTFKIKNPGGKPVLTKLKALENE